jgi:predicted small metal-binding protein
MVDLGCPICNWEGWASDIREGVKRIDEHWDARHSVYNSEMHAWYKRTQSLEE